METLEGDYSLDELIELEAIRRGVSPKTVRGMLRAESSGKHEALSGKGARGLMQVMPSTARDMGFTGSDEELHDPKMNIALGVEYFKRQLERYGGDVTKALAAYNAGPGAVDKYGGVPPFEETENYVERVKNQSYKEGGKVGVFDRPVSPQRIKPVNDNDLEAMIERALGKVLGFASGGQVPGFAKGGKAPAVGINFGPNSGGIMGGIQNTAQKLSAFNPLIGQAQQTTNQLLATGAPTDVSGITQANIQQGQDVFQNMVAPEVNEQFGALGLGSSTARTQALGREAGRIATNIGAEGLRAGVQAQESATGRRLETLNPYLGATGQQLSGLQSAGQLGLGGAGIASNERLAGSQLAQNAAQFQAGLNQTAALANQQLGLPSSPSGLGGVPKYSMVGGGDSFRTYASGGNVSNERIMNMSRFGGENSGRVDERDFLSNLLYGVKFKPPAEIKEPTYAQRSSYVSRSSGEGGGYSSGDINRRNRELAAQRAHELKLANIPFNQAMEMRRLDKLKASGDAQKLAVGLLGGPRAYRQAGDFESLANTIGAIGVPAAHAGLMQTGQLLGAQTGSARSMGSLAAKGYNSPLGDLLQALQQQPQAKAQGGEVQDYMPMDEWDMGGKVDGPAVPPDRVHIMAQGGEGVLPVKMMHKLEGYQSDDPMIQEIKNLMFGGHQPEDEYAQGGQVERGKLIESTSKGEGSKEAGEIKGTTQVKKLLAMLSAAQIAKVKAMQDPSKAWMFSIPGVPSVTSLPDLEAKYDPKVIEALKLRFPAAWPAPPTTTTTVPPENFAKGGKVEKVMHEFEAGTLHSGSKQGPKVTSRKQAIAIALSEQRKAKKSGYAQGGPIPTGKSKVAETPPLESLSYANLKAVNPNTRSFGDADLAKYEGYGTNPGLDPVSIDSQIESINLERANEDRRRSLYEMLMATSSAGARAKLANLYALSASKIKGHEERLGQLQSLKVQSELAKQQQAALDAYRQGQLGLGQARVGIQDEALRLKIQEAAQSLGLDPEELINFISQREQPKKEEE